MQLKVQAHFISLAFNLSKHQTNIIPMAQNKHNRNLDILRGVAALTVVLFHVISCYPTVFDKNFELGYFLNYNFPGHMGVLVFFILSGYVIAVNNPSLPDRKSISRYIRKRLIRIVPIYFVAMVFTFAITYGRYDLRQMLSNFFFVSVPFDNVTMENGPLWSLNYELLYYFAFIFFAYYNISLVRTVKALIATIAVLFIFFHNVHIYPLVISYLIGFLFWCTGAMIATIGNWPRWKITSSRIIAILILIFCLQPFNPYGPILKVLKIPMADYSAYSWYQQSITYSDLYYYPLTILLILSLTHAYAKRGVWLLYFLFISATIRLMMIFKVYGWAFVVKEHYLAPAIILLLSIMLWALNFEVNTRVKKAILATSSLGGISYGIYMIHLPLMFFFGMSGSCVGWLLALKFVGYFVMLFVMAYLLEHKFQPYVKKLLGRNK